MNNMPYCQQNWCDYCTSVKLVASVLVDSELRVILDDFKNKQSF